ncbi:hypothetical protein ACIQFU_08770 [Streptomyces sp. NPDC093065]|uniref:hypothetical protein n=1 Tax=Streptomyces sp. NPDC093065 TaxID=3366021 RepID=UPI00380C0555
MDTEKQAARGLVDIEAFLHREAQLRAARQRVEDFTARADGLTLEQRRRIERWYLEEQRYVAHMVTEHIAESLNAAEEAHRVRFGRWLRGTLVGTVLITLATFVCTAAVVGTMH